MLQNEVIASLVNCWWCNFNDRFFFVNKNLFPDNEAQKVYLSVQKTEKQSVTVSPQNRFFKLRARAFLSYERETACFTIYLYMNA